MVDTNMQNCGKDMIKKSKKFLRLSVPPDYDNTHNNQNIISVALFADFFKQYGWT